MERCVLFIHSHRLESQCFDIAQILDIQLIAYFLLPEGLHTLTLGDSGNAEFLGQIVLGKYCFQSSVDCVMKQWQ